MIRLDIVTFELFELPPIRNEDFMRTFGTSNMIQAQKPMILRSLWIQWPLL
jgi:hypothetical protein